MDLNFEKMNGLIPAIIQPRTVCGQKVKKAGIS